MFRIYAAPIVKKYHPFTSPLRHHLDMLFTEDLKFSFVRKAEVSDSLNPLGSSGGSTQNKEPNSEGGTCHIGADRNAFTALYEAKMCMGRRRIIYRPGGNPEETGIDR